MTTQLYIKRCRFGQGVFAAKAIKAGQHILSFSGPIIPLQSTLATGERQCYLLQVGWETYMDVEIPGRLLNHSCDPNAGIFHDTELRALRDIAAKEQIFFDYSTTMDEDHTLPIWTMDCSCGSPRCRKVVQDFKYLPPAIQIEYLQKGIVQNFIAAQYKQSCESQRLIKYR